MRGECEASASQLDHLKGDSEMMTYFLFSTNLKERRSRLDRYISIPSRLPVPTYSHTVDEKHDHPGQSPDVCVHFNVCTPRSCHLRCEIRLENGAGWFMCRIPEREKGHMR